MPDLRHRKYDEEFMDDLSSGGLEMDVTLRELDVINRLLGGNSATLNPVKRYIKKNRSREISIVDLGCGSGEMLRKIAKWAEQRGYRVSLLGVDANEYVVSYARNQSESFKNITFASLDVFSAELGSLCPDIFLCTLFLHHFNEEQLQGLIATLHTNAELVVINDIHRHWFAYHSIKILTAFFSRSKMVKNDAALSVERSFTKWDISSILSRAGIARYTLRWRWAFRWQVTIF